MGTSVLITLLGLKWIAISLSGYPEQNLSGYPMDSDIITYCKFYTCFTSILLRET